MHIDSCHDLSENFSASGDLDFLREEADKAGLSTELLAQLQQRFADRDSLHVVDLACGTGSHLRNLAPFFPNRQYWTLANKDRAQLMLAVSALAAWADSASMDAGQVVLEKGKQHIYVQLAHHDVTQAKIFWDGQPDIFTLRSGLDTMTKAVIAWLSHTAARVKAVFYAPMLPPYNFVWDEPHIEDSAILKAHSAWCTGSAKRLGQAGDQAAVAVSKCFKARGYMVSEAVSVWNLSGSHLALNTDMVERITRRVRDRDAIPELILNDWAAARAHASHVRVSHHDVLAVPPSK